MANAVASAGAFAKAIARDRPGRHYGALVGGGAKIEGAWGLMAGVSAGAPDDGAPAGAAPAGGAAVGWVGADWRGFSFPRRGAPGICEVSSALLASLRGERSAERRRGLLDPLRGTRLRRVRGPLLSGPLAFRRSTTVFS